MNQPGFARRIMAMRGILPSGVQPTPRLPLFPPQTPKTNGD